MSKYFAIFIVIITFVITTKSKVKITQINFIAYFGFYLTPATAAGGLINLQPHFIVVVIIITVSIKITITTTTTAITIIKLNTTAVAATATAANPFVAIK